MGIPNTMFWALLIMMALFYIIKGNDMHKEKIQIRMNNIQEVNTTK